jgi:hypothetical protein
VRALKLAGVIGGCPGGRPFGILLGMPPFGGPGCWWAG